MPTVTLSAPAKVNLGLTVGPRRPDGFHDITTVVVPVELCDTVRIRTARSGITVAADTDAVPSGPGNLAHAAAGRFFRAAGIDAGCRITLTKRVPPGAGLGGGSADAAATLLGLNRLFGRPLAARRLRRIAAALGSDVPALLARRPCAARGRGERLRPVRLPRLRFLLHLPGYPVSTAWAYRALDRSRPRPLTASRLSPKILGLKLRRHELAGAAPLIRNDFEPVVFRRHPDLARVRELLLASGCWAAALSGSGSTVYGLVERGAQDPMAAMARHGFPCIATASLRARDR